MAPIVRPLVAIAALSVLAGPALAEEPPAAADRSASPYFVVESGADGVDGFPLKATRADVRVSGTIAHVRVTQVYENAGDTPIEALYVFPGSTRAAVFAMRMTVGDRTIVAQIDEREAARDKYEEAKSEGKRASLLEQQRPNVFQMNVANVMPGDRIEVQLDYTELLVPEDGVYELVYPAVVGPRFTGERTPEEAAADGWTATPHTREGVDAAYAWDLNVSLDTGLPAAEVASPSHRIALTRPTATTVGLTVDPADPVLGTRDFVLRYRLAGADLASGALLYPGAADGDESFFLAMVQPPRRVVPDDIPPREYVFVVDVSGSMDGFPLDTAAALVERLLRSLRADERFNLLFFAGGSQLFSDSGSVEATEERVDAAVDMMQDAEGKGGTNLLAALQRVLDQPALPGSSRTFVVITDGFVSVEDKTFELVRSHLGQANLFAFGIGSSVNRHLIEGLARAGLGAPFVALHDDDATEQAARFFDTVRSPVLTEVEVAFDGFDAYAIEPASIPDVFAERPVLIFGKYRGAPAGTLTVSGRSGADPWSQTLALTDASSDPANVALRYLWARQRVDTLADLDSVSPSDARKAELTRLGLKYGLLTKYTSFVAVDTVVANDGGEPTVVKQPLPLPAGVTDRAIGDAGILHAEAASMPFAYEPAAPFTFGLRLGAVPWGEAEYSNPTEGLVADEDPAFAAGLFATWNPVSIFSVGPSIWFFSGIGDFYEGTAQALGVDLLLQLRLPVGVVAAGPWIEVGGTFALGSPGDFAGWNVGGGLAIEVALSESLGLRLDVGVHRHGLDGNAGQAIDGVRMITTLGLTWSPGE